jgi:hypothetical protein
MLLVALLSPLALKGRSRLLLAPFMLVFLVANVVVFQPWAWDNTKILVFWYMASAVAVGSLLVRGWRARIVGRMAAAGIWLSLVASGVLSLVPFLPGLSPDYSWFTSGDIQLAAEIRQLTPPHSIFLTGDEPNNPVADLAGRTVLMSYEGWLWTEGINYAERQAAIATIYTGGDRAADLLRRYRVDYVVIGPDELTTYHANRAYFESNFPLLINIDGYEIFRIKGA